MDIVHWLRHEVHMIFLQGEPNRLHEAADEIERLRVKLNEATKLAEDSILAAESFHKRNIQASKLMAESLDEIERLREALQEIACDCDHCCNENGLGCDNWTARSVLQQKVE